LHTTRLPPSVRLRIEKRCTTICTKRPAKARKRLAVFYKACRVAQDTASQGDTIDLIGAVSDAAAQGFYTCSAILRPEPGSPLVVIYQVAGKLLGRPSGRGSLL